NITAFFKRHIELTRARLGRAGAGPAGRVESTLSDLAALSYERILETKVAFGAAGSLTERLGRVRDELGLDAILAEGHPGGLLPLGAMGRRVGIPAHGVLPPFRGGGRLLGPAALGRGGRPPGLSSGPSGDRVLKGLDPLLAPELLHALAAMGHGDEVVV